MNKYQKALSDMVDNGVTIDYFNEKAKLPQSENPLFTIQELVDRATPIKPIVTIQDGVRSVDCPICDEGYAHNYGGMDLRHDYCLGCGQKIDWKKEETK